MRPALERLGVAWWNAATRAERGSYLEAAEKELGKSDVSPAEAFAVWYRRRRAEKLKTKLEELADHWRALAAMYASTSDYDRGSRQALMRAAQNLEALVRD